MFPNLWVSLIGGAVLLILGAAGGGYAVSVYKDGEIARMERDQAVADKARANADLKQFQDISKQINVAAQDFLKTQTNIGTQFDTIQKDLKDVQAKTPLPRNCKPTVDRVRKLDDAIAAANSAAGY